MYVKHPLLVIDACDEYDKPMSYKKNPDMGWTQKPSKFDLEVKVKVILGLKMYATHHLIVIHPFAKYG